MRPRACTPAATWLWFHSRYTIWYVCFLTYLSRTFSDEKFKTSQSTAFPFSLIPVIRKLLLFCTKSFFLQVSLREKSTVLGSLQNPVFFKPKDSCIAWKYQVPWTEQLFYILHRHAAAFSYTRALCKYWEIPWFLA